MTRKIQIKVTDGKEFNEEKEGLGLKKILKKQKKDRPKIFERNPDTDVIRWRYIDESPDKFGWPNYGRILKTKKKK